MVFDVVELLGELYSMNVFDHHCEPVLLCPEGMDLEPNKHTNTTINHTQHRDIRGSSKQRIHPRRTEDSLSVDKPGPEFWEALGGIQKWGLLYVCVYIFFVQKRSKDWIVVQWENGCTSLIPYVASSSF